MGGLRGLAGSGFFLARMILRGGRHALRFGAFLRAMEHLQIARADLAGFWREVTASPFGGKLQKRDAARAIG